MNAEGISELVPEGSFWVFNRKKLMTAFVCRLKKQKRRSNMKKLTVKKGTQCMACLECVRACSEAFYKEFDPSKACLQIIERNGAAKPMVCVQCGKCAEACEHGAITQNAKGVYTINKKLCVGCGKCAESCPAHIIKMKEDRSGRKRAVFQKKGCISCFCCQEMCPMKAISVKKAL